MPESNTQPDVDLDLLAVHLKRKMVDDELSLRSAAAALGCSPATLSRMLRGSRASTYPDSKTLFTAISWLGKSIGDFEKQKKPTQTTIADVEVHLRALPGLDETDIQALVALVKAAHVKGMALKQSKK